MEENKVVTKKEKKPWLQWQRDLVYGIVIVLFSIANIIYGRSLPPGSIKLHVAQAGFYLQIVCICFGVCGLYLIIRSLIKKPDAVCEPLFKSTGVVTIAVMVAYIATVKAIGFVIDSFLLVLILATYYSYKQGKLSEGFKSKKTWKKIAIYAIFAAIMVVVCYLLFAVLMTVILPRGILYF